MDDEQDLLLERRGDGIAVLTLNRPERLNALRRATVQRLRAELDALATDNSVRVLVLTGAGRGFCAGLDLGAPLQAAEGGQPVPRSVASLNEGQELFAGMVLRLRALPQTVIAAVNGVAVGAGFALTLGADLRIAAPGAAFHVGAVRIGLTAGECGISYHLPRLIGAARAFELMLTGRPLPADEAERFGLVSAVVPAEELLPRALDLAQQVLRNSPYATRHTKQLMWANLEAPSLGAAIELENRAQLLALMTEDFHEAVAAFGEKRPPRFTGR